MDSYCLAYGQIEKSLSWPDLRQLFPYGRFWKSSYYRGSQYLQLEDVATSRITFEKTEDDILLSGEAETPELLSSICQAASATLSGHHIRHRIELYDTAQILYDYFHHAWPQEPST